MNDLQRTEEWYQQRIGHLTASMAKDLIRYQKGGITLQTDAKITNLKYRILAEQLTGQATEDHFTADARRRMPLRTAAWARQRERRARIPRRPRT